MWLTYLSVRTIELRTQQYQYNTTSPSMSRRLARQSYLYVGALYLTNIPLIVTRVTQFIAGETYYGMMLSIAILVPMQGFWNVIVFLRPRKMKETGGRLSGFWKAVSQSGRKRDSVQQDIPNTEETELQSAHDPIEHRTSSIAVAGDELHSAHDPIEHRTSSIAVAGDEA